MHARWHREKATHGHMPFWKFKNHLSKLWKEMPAQEKEKFLELIGKTEINKLVDEKKVFENEPRLYGVSSSGDEEKTVVKKGG